MFSLEEGHGARPDDEYFGLEVNHSKPVPGQAVHMGLNQNQNQYLSYQQQQTQSYPHQHHQHHPSTGSVTTSPGFSTIGGAGTHRRQLSSFGSSGDFSLISEPLTPPSNINNHGHGINASQLKAPAQLQALHVPSSGVGGGTGTGSNVTNGGPHAPVYLSSNEPVYYNSGILSTPVTQVNYPYGTSAGTTGSGSSGGTSPFVQSQNQHSASKFGHAHSRSFSSDRTSDRSSDRSIGLYGLPTPASSIHAGGAISEVPSPDDHYGYNYNYNCNYNNNYHYNNNASSNSFGQFQGHPPAQGSQYTPGLVDGLDLVSDMNKLNLAGSNRAAAPGPLPHTTSANTSLVTSPAEITPPLQRGERGDSVSFLQVDTTQDQFPILVRRESANNGYGAAARPPFVSSFSNMTSGSLGNGVYDLLDPSPFADPGTVNNNNGSHSSSSSSSSSSPLHSINSSANPSARPHAYSAGEYMVTSTVPYALYRSNSVNNGRGPIATTGANMNMNLNIGSGAGIHLNGADVDSGSKDERHGLRVGSGAGNIGGSGSGSGSNTRSSHQSANVNATGYNNSSNSSSSNNNKSMHNNGRGNMRKNSNNRRWSSSGASGVGEGATTGGSSVDDTVNSNKYAQLDVETLGKEVLTLCKDQHGCRFLQRKLEEQSPESLNVIFKETKDHVVELMTDPFGNYLCQKLFEHASCEQRTVLMSKASKDMVKVALNQHGTRALQKMIEYVDTPEQVDIIVASLSSNVVDLIKDLNGNHVIQKCLNRLDHDGSQFVYDAVCANCVEVGTHRHGCCVLQRCIDYASEDQSKQLVQEITRNASRLVQDPFGNYVTQYVLDLNVPEYCRGLVEQFMGSICALSMQKFSSNVIEKCLRTGEGETVQRMVGELIDCGPLMEGLLRDSYANYVIQTALDVADSERRAQLVAKIRPLLASIRSTPYGRRIQLKIGTEA